MLSFVSNSPTFHCKLQRKMLRNYWQQQALHGPKGTEAHWGLQGKKEKYCRWYIWCFLWYIYISQKNSRGNTVALWICYRGVFVIKHFTGARRDLKREPLRCHNMLQSSCHGWVPELSAKRAPPSTTLLPACLCAAVSHRQCLVCHTPGAGGQWHCWAGGSWHSSPKPKWFSSTRHKTATCGCNRSECQLPDERHSCGTKLLGMLPSWSCVYPNQGSCESSSSPKLGEKNKRKWNSQWH